MRISRRFPDRPRIELVAMIDTMSFLLVFFMVASLAMSRQAGLPVRLPTADSAPAQTWGDRALVITLDRQGRVFLDQDEVDLRALLGALRTRLAARPDAIVVINADESIRHRQVMAAMDAAKQAGAQHMAIATRPTDERDRAGP